MEASATISITTAHDAAPGARNPEDRIRPEPSSTSSDACLLTASVFVHRRFHPSLPGSVPDGLQPVLHHHIARSMPDRLAGPMSRLIPTRVATLVPAAVQRLVPADLPAPVPQNMH
jgi:hypothetical protein